MRRVGQPIESTAEGAVRRRVTCRLKEKLTSGEISYLFEEDTGSEAEEAEEADKEDKNKVTFC